MPYVYILGRLFCSNTTAVKKYTPYTSLRINTIISVSSFLMTPLRSIKSNKFFILIEKLLTLDMIR